MAIRDLQQMKSFLQEKMDELDVSPIITFYKEAR